MKAFIAYLVRLYNGKFKLVRFTAFGKMLYTPAFITVTGRSALEDLQF